MPGQSTSAFVAWHWLPCPPPFSHFTKANVRHQRCPPASMYEGSSPYYNSVRYSLSFNFDGRSHQTVKPGPRYSKTKNKGDITTKSAPARLTSMNSFRLPPELQYSSMFQELAGFEFEKQLKRPVLDI